LGRKYTGDLTPVSAESKIKGRGRKKKLAWGRGGLTHEPGDWMQPPSKPQRGGILTQRGGHKLTENDF